MRAKQLSALWSRLSISSSTFRSLLRNPIYDMINFPSSCSDCFFLVISAGDILKDSKFCQLPTIVTWLAPLALKWLPSISPTVINWTLFIVISILLLMIGFFGYLGMQLWYKNKYEKYLFPNRNDLLNLVLYIDNARNKGINEREIENKLKKSGWKSEQVSYAMKKYFGKKTGMLLEIPIEKVIGIFKKKSDLNKINPSNQRRF